MPSRAERSHYRLAAYAVLAMVAGLAVIPAYLALAPAWRPLAVRLACALAVILACVRLIGAVRRTVDGATPSVLDAPPPAPRAHSFDDRFLRTRDHLLFGHRRQRYFDVFLWPRLRALGGEDLRPPPPGRRRGPSWPALERVIVDIEKRT